VSQRIRVDTDGLLRFAKQYELIASEFEKNGARVYQSTYSLNDYGGQLPLKNSALSAQRDANDIRDDLREDAEHLRALANRFEKTDQELGGKILPFLPPPPKDPLQEFTNWRRNFELWWDPNTPDGTPTRPGDNNFGPTQNINLEKLIPGFKYKPPKAENGFSRRLCGPLCLLHLAGITDPAAGFLLLIAAGKYFEDILTGDKLTSPKDLMEMCKILGLTPGPLTTFPAGTNIDPKTFQDILDAGGKVMVLVNATCPPGTITDPVGGLDSSHWVTVEDIWVDSTGTTWVEVYNPYNNQYEAYRWDTLEAAMQTPGTGSPGGGYYFSVYPGESEKESANEN
jgi:hypothetical protein